MSADDVDEVAEIALPNCAIPTGGANCRGSTPANPMVRDPGLVMRWHRLDDARRLTGEVLPARYYCLEMRLQGRPWLVRTRLGLQVVYWMISTPPLLALIY